MKKIFYSTLILSTLSMAVDYKMVFNKTVALDSTKKVELQLFQEDKDYEISNSVKIRINNSKGESMFNFFDNSSNVPIYNFGKIKLNTNIKNKKLIDLKSTVTVLDMDGNGKNEIIIYGEYYNPLIEHGTGNLLILEQNKRGIVQKIPIILGYDSHEIKFYSKEHLLIFAESEVDSEKMDLNNHYLYQFYIYDMKNPFTKIPILLSKKRIDEKSKSIIDKNLSEILGKYAIYKEGKVAKTKELNLIKFVNAYWETIARNYSLDFIEEHLKDEVLYENKKVSKKSFLTKKKNILKNLKRVEFTLDKFLLYQKDGKYYIEYNKYSNMENKKSKESGSHVKSLMIIDEVEGKFMIESEKDLRTLSTE